MKSVLTVLFSSLLIFACSGPAEETKTDEKPVEAAPAKPVNLECPISKGTVVLRFQGAANSAADKLVVTMLGKEVFEGLSVSPGAAWPLGKYEGTLNRTVALEIKVDSGNGMYTGSYTEPDWNEAVNCKMVERN